MVKWAATGKDSNPLLEEVCMVEFRVGEAKMYFKRPFNDSDFKSTDCMKKKDKVIVNEKTFMSSQPPPPPQRESWTRLWSKTEYSRQALSSYAHRLNRFLEQSLVCIEAVNY